jgi:hypothetical protein
MALALKLRGWAEVQDSVRIRLTLCKAYIRIAGQIVFEG